MSNVADLDFETRLKKAQSMKIQFPKSIPVIVLKHPSSKLEQLAKSKFIVPKDLTIGQLNHVIRKRLKLKPEQTIFLFAGKKLATTGQIVGCVYEELHSDDEFLYMTYAEMETFG